MGKELKHILCIDDEHDILEVAKMCLETVGGYTVTCIDSGTKALKQVQQSKPDLILVDYMMPEMDGPETLRELRFNMLLKNTPIVYMTARVQPKEVKEYLENGATAVIRKPFDPMTLSQEVQRIWDEFHE
jgi:two-component system OmpR family response regulator